MLASRWCLCACRGWREQRKHGRAAWPTGGPRVGRTGCVGERAGWPAIGGSWGRREVRSAGAVLADQALAVVGFADDGHYFLGLVDDADQRELGGADVRPGEDGLLEPGPQGGPVLPA